MCYFTFDLKMKKIGYIFIYVAFINVPRAKCSIPGTFFWKPRLGLDLAVPTTEFKLNVNLRTRENIEEGLVVLIDGYQMGLSVISIASGASNINAQTPHFDPTSAAFTTNFYRWALRYFSSIPYWIGGKGGNFCDTLKLWRRRFYYMDEQEKRCTSLP
ncbi:uncharacterized protein LOC124645489 [Helicoverpa zea]|uniref:uncharacterized protein LOC124645489 n=1 Tax=Helicoverpa zea TaxID=7113 RepID=UPI001F564302|nr:uncharacterized protein LOC124645489 [Helicoverpa zea]